jgi:hypothetical protein
MKVIFTVHLGGEDDEFPLSPRFCCRDFGLCERFIQSVVKDRLVCRQL